jgi:cytochrome c
MRRSGVLFTILLLVIFLSAFIIHEQGNGMPKISLQLKPAQRTFSAGTGFSYTITVEDKEDGSSRYEEIAGSEVFLEMKYLTDSGMLKKFLAQQKSDAPVLLLLKKGTCFNCHSLRNKLAGPSFTEVITKYSKKPMVTEYLAGRIINGSKGVWGDSQLMPSHPEITVEQGKSIAAWILKQAADPTYDLQTGLDGKFKPATAPKPGPKSLYVLIPSYLDHGVNGGNAQEARQVVTLAYKP